jgi:hypothetical protein
VVPVRDLAVDVVVTGTVVATANYAYLPFDVPPGVTRLDLRMETNRPAILGLGLFDARGAGYQSPGFRGICSGERREVFLGLREATPGFTPGPIPAGTWTVIVPVFLAVLPTQVRIRVRMTHGPQVVPVLPEPLPGVVNDTPGWYRGDLHCHTEASSDAWRTGTALRPGDWAHLARSLGLDFLALTDHNVISQNLTLTGDSVDGVLLLAGEEVTNYFHGHATVSGIQPGEWFDFRQSPFGLPLPTGGGRIQDLIRRVREAGGYLSAAHPTLPGMSWQFLAEGLVSPACRPDGLEVWNGNWQVSDEAALRVWHRLLCEGWDVAANGGSDLHAVINDRGVGPGTPTTVVHASALSREAIVDAVRAGRSYVTRHAQGVELYLTATGAGGQHTYTGGRLYNVPGSTVTIRVVVRRGSGMRLTVITRKGPVVTIPLDSDDQSVDLTLTMPDRDTFVRAEVRGRPRTVNSLSLMRLDMEAFTNPIRLLTGSPPGFAASASEYAPPPPPR